MHFPEPLTMDCYSPYEATRAYETIFSSTGIYHDDRTLEMFTKIFYLLDFDLTSDREAVKNI